MDCFIDYRLIEEEDGNTVILTLNPDCTEFSSELGTSFKENLLELDDQIRKLIDEKFSGVKVNTVKLALGAAIVATLPFAHHTKAHAVTTGTPTGVTQLNTSGVVKASRLNMRRGPSTGYSIMHVLWRGNVVKVIGESNGWYRIRLSDGRIGWVNGAYLQITSRAAKINIVISTAKSLLGTPYVWGGESLAEGGFDCSGFTRYVYSKAGYTLNRISADQARQGIYVSRQYLQPGDLVFYSFEGTSNINHVGIYIGNGQMIHSPKTGDVVKVTNITTSYWESRFVTARRIIQ